MNVPLSSAKQRIRDMEVLLLWEGTLDNARVREVFGLQMVQASRTVASFIAEHKQSVIRATSHAPVTALPSFTPLYASGKTDEYLRLVAQAQPASVAPHVVDARVDLSPVHLAHFALLNRACRLGLGVRLQYRSLSQPTGSERLVFPHSLVLAARRWHVRAWCTLRQDFRDFALGRIASALPTEETMTDTESRDVHWRERVHLRVGAHPALTEGQAALLRDEYLGGNETAEIEVRRALLSYVVQDLRMATNPQIQAPPAYQLVLLNASSFVDAFAVAGQP